MLLQERRELGRVEMIGVVRNRFELRSRDGLRCETIVTQPPLRTDRIAEAAAIVARQPVRYEIHLREALREHQRVVIEVIGCARRPVREPCALFESRIALSE